MQPHSIVLVLFASLFSSAAFAGPAPPVVTVTTVSIVRASSGGKRMADQIVDLVKHDIGEVDLDDPSIVRNRRHLEDDELAALLAAWRSIPTTPAKQPSEGPPPGGFLHYVVRDKNGAAIYLSHNNGAPTGKPYIVLTDEQLSALGIAWPALAASKRAPSPRTP
jgi:hypothetical protein